MLITRTLLIGVGLVVAMAAACQRRTNLDPDETAPITSPKPAAEPATGASSGGTGSSMTGTGSTGTGTTTGTAAPLPDEPTPPAMPAPSGETSPGMVHLGDTGRTVSSGSTGTGTATGTASGTSGTSGTMDGTGGDATSGTGGIVSGPVISPADADRTSRVRRAIMAENTLSDVAREIEVTTADGVVTLVGQVASLAERKLVIRRATQVAGQGNVLDALLLVAETPSPAAKPTTP